MTEARSLTIAETGVPIDSRFYLAPAAGMGWLAGIWFASFINLSALDWLALAAPIIVGAVALWRRGRMGLALAAFGALALGGARYTAARPPLDPGQIHYYNGAKGIVVLGEVTTAPELSDTRAQSKVAVREVIIDGQTRPVAGSLMVETGRFSPIPYGVIVRLSGDITSVEESNSPGYAAYLERRGIYSTMRFAGLEVLSEGGGSPLIQALLRIKERGRKTIAAALPEPHAALLTGILLGDDSGMPRTLDDAFRETGMTHIIAISG